MRLADTHDPVIYAASIMFVHPHLLTKHLGDDQQIFVLTPIK
jgi:hypothetical protein